MLKQINDGGNKKLYEKSDLEKHLEDFFDFIIWESISMIFSEVSVKVNKDDIRKFRKNLKVTFLKSLLKSEYSDIFNEQVNDLYKNSSFINKTMGEYITQSLSIFRLRLYNFLNNKETVEFTIDNSKIEDIKNIVEEYVLLAYLDKFILSDIVRVILYSADISFAEINEFRIHLIEVFKESLEPESEITLKEINDFLKNKLKKLSLKPLIREFVSSSIFGYITMILRTPDISEMIKEMKKMVYNRISFNTDLTFLESKKVKLILEWLSENGIMPFLDLLKTFRPKSNISLWKISESILNIFRKLLERKIVIDTGIEKLQNLKSEIMYFFPRNISNDFFPRNVSNEKIYSFYSFLNKGGNSSGKHVIIGKEQTHCKPLLEEFLDLENMIDLFITSMVYLAKIFDEELTIDLKLDNLCKLIKEHNFKYDQLYL
ncbi:MAG: hypothetical protein ACTSWY_06085 [Promethearchaeota archaeon]